MREHEIRAIIGPNGAGKSSMLNCINGVYQPQQGSITFRGKTFRHMNSRQVAEMGVARTFQNLALFKGMSVLDNIMTGRNLKMRSNLLRRRCARGAGRARGDRASRVVVERIIDFLEIQPYRKTPVGRLPYGLQKRVDLGRALAMEPQVLLLDEPMAGMNVEEKQDMSRFILDVNDEFGTTIVLIEHDMGVVMDISRPRRGARLRQEDRRRHAATRCASNPDVIQRLPRNGCTDMGFFLETLFGGLMVGMLYSLVALGFVLIYKASGVFNFAQGAMVLFAALAMARFAEWIPQLTGLRQQGARQRARLRRARRLVMIVAGLAGRAAGARQARQPGRHHAADGDAGHRLFPRRARPDALRQRHLQDRHRHAQGADVHAREASSRAACCVNQEDLIAALIAAVLVVAARAVLPEDADRPRAARRGRRSPGGAVDRHSARTASGSSSGRSPASSRWSPASSGARKLGVQFSLSLVALKALPVVILGGLTSIPGAIIGGLLIGVGEKLSEVYSARMLGGGIEIWFAYVLALVFLLVRPQGLFGEKIIDRV